MPWIKATPKMGGKFEFSMDDISRGKVYKTAEECMDSFGMFEKDDSFGPLMTCRPIFFPLNDEELEAFKAAFAAGKTSAEEGKKTDKMDELAGTLVDLCNMVKDSVTGLVNREPWKAYDIDEVDAAIAELKSEIANGDVSRITWIDKATELKAENEQLKAKLENVQASAYADSVDAGMRERRLKRALYKACANWAHFAVAFFSSYIIKNLWHWMELKCLKKAEEYR